MHDHKMIKMSKSKLMQNIGQSFKTKNFKSMAQLISNNMRLEKGLPLSSITLQEVKSNIELGGGTEASVKVSIVKNG